MVVLVVLQPLAVQAVVENQTLVKRVVLAQRDKVTLEVQVLVVVAVQAAAAVKAALVSLVRVATVATAAQAQLV